MPIINVKTEITGIVWKIVAPQGAEVAEEAAIVILESMKMEIPVAAPEAGVVVELMVNEGEIVTEGSVVARLKV